VIDISVFFGGGGGGMIMVYVCELTVEKPPLSWCFSMGHSSNWCCVTEAGCRCLHTRVMVVDQRCNS